jgi:hypothetical protein
MNTENPLWGAPRIHGELLKLGIKISQATVGDGYRGGPRSPPRPGGAFCATTCLIAVADDYSDPDGVAILNFQQAQRKARERFLQRAYSAAGKTGPYTVADAMDAYLEFQEARGNSIVDAEHRDQAHIRPKLGDWEVATLKADTIKKWHATLAKASKRIRTARRSRPAGWET